MSKEAKPTKLPHGIGKAVAEKTGVSRSVVSKVLNNRGIISAAVRLKVLGAAKKIKAELAKQAAKGDELLAAL